MVFSRCARILGWASAGVDPRRMGIGPVPAVRKLLERLSLPLDDFDLVELNEAFAPQVLAVLRDLPIDPDRLNVNGGAIALGHPIGCTGTRILVTLVHDLRAPPRAPRARDAVRERRDGDGDGGGADVASQRCGTWATARTLVSLCHRGPQQGVVHPSRNWEVVQPRRAVGEAPRRSHAGRRASGTARTRRRSDARLPAASRRGARRDRGWWPPLICVSSTSRRPTCLGRVAGRPCRAP